MAVTVATASVVAQQVALVEAIEARPGLQKQMGNAAYRELLDLVMQLDDIRTVNSILIETLYPRVLAGIEREQPSLRPAIGRVRQVLEARRFRGVRLTKDEQRMTYSPFDTLEERDGLV